MQVIFDMPGKGNLRPYKAFYKGRTLDIEAKTSYEAQILAAKIFKAKKRYDVTVMLCDVVHNPADIGG